MIAQRRPRPASAAQRAVGRPSGALDGPLCRPARARPEAYQVRFRLQRLRVQVGEWRLAGAAASCNAALAALCDTLLAMSREARARGLDGFARSCDALALQLRDIAGRACEPVWVAARLNQWIEQSDAYLRRHGPCPSAFEAPGRAMAVRADRDSR